MQHITRWEGDKKSAKKVSNIVLMASQMMQKEMLNKLKMF